MDDAAACKLGDEGQEEVPLQSTFVQVLWRSARRYGQHNARCARPARSQLCLQVSSMQQQCMHVGRLGAAG